MPSFHHWLSVHLGPLIGSRQRLLFASGLLAACLSGGPTDNPDPTATFRILFVGNSLTYVNDLPGMVKALADSTGQERTYVETVAFPNFGLEDHWAQGDAATAVHRGGWRYVVMQQGPSALPESRVNLIEWARRLAGEIIPTGAIPAMYTVWPSVDRSFDFDRVVESYQLAADSIGGQVLPAGAAWLAAWRLDSSIALYGSDGFHPSTTGTYLAALTVFGGLYQRSVVGVPAQLRVPGGTVSIGPALALLLQRAADEANGR